MNSTITITLYDMTEADLYGLEDIINDTLLNRGYCSGSDFVVDIKYGE